MTEEFTAWVTKYALTSGIQVITARSCSENMIEKTSETKRSYGNDYFHGNDWHRTPEGALCRAEQMRVKRIASLEKSIRKLQEMKFE